MNTTNESSTDDSDVEGLGETDPSSWGDYPIDTLLIRNENRTVHDVLRRIDQGQFVMNPDFQRDFIWDTGKQSKLIESVLMRIPLPVLYLAEDEQGRMIVVDGLQRLTTFQRFNSNELTLTLPDRPELDGKRFDDLIPKLQNRIEDCNLILYVIDAKAPEQTRLDIFERVNGGVPLTRQQMRNCLYMGPSTRFLREQSETKLFLDVTGRSLRPSVMRDREFVNRFCAFQIQDVGLYRDMDVFLADSLRMINSQPDSISQLKQQFRTTLKNNRLLFGKHAFRKHQAGQQNRSIINASLWDVMSTGLSRYPGSVVSSNQDAVRQSFFSLLDDEDFAYSITYSTSSPQQVKRRFSMAHSALEEVLGAYSA